MSRYGKIPIFLPKGVELKITDKQLTVKGPKGELKLSLKDGILLNIEEENVFIDIDEKSLLTKAMHGLFRSLINNMIVGVSKGFKKKLNLLGVGYRAFVSDQTLDLQLGFSHPTKINIPAGIEVKAVKLTTIIISGIDKQAVGQFAATVRSERSPEPYKGKGIRYEGEYVRKKAGKVAKGK